MMDYRKEFDPNHVERFVSKTDEPTHKGDTRTQSVYVYDERIVLAINVALATGRPLLIRGPSGCGKSTLARSVANILGRRYYERVISSRTQARDLLWEVDLLKRLQDAQAHNLKDDMAYYVRPGVLWWAFDKDSAAEQFNKTVSNGAPVDQPGENVQFDKAVVLLDEIDKADPDVPNNLLVPLGSLQFQVEETSRCISARHSPLVFLTTNEERQLPTAFLRRCIELKLKDPAKEDLVRIGRAHFPKLNSALLEKVATLIMEQSAATDVPSVAEYLDTVRACDELNIELETSHVWDNLSKITLWKHGRKQRGAT
jgi:MoxR-like ATPase